MKKETRKCRCYGQCQVSLFIIKEYRFTELVVIYSHELDLHNGLRETLTQLRSEYWVVKARNFIKKVLRNCIICRKHEGQSYKYPPEHRYLGIVLLVNKLLWYRLRWACIY